MNWNELLKVRPLNTENNEFIITIGNHLADEKRFSTREEAQAEIDKTNFNLVSAVVAAIIEAERKMKNKEEEEFINEVESEEQK